MVKPSVSVVMPVRNEEEHLRAALERVLEQSYSGAFEVLLVVGPSEDQTRDIADELARLHPAVVVLDNPTGFTPAGLNLGIEASNAEVIVRVDGHGELCPGYIDTAVDLLTQTGAANVGGLMDARGTTAVSEAIAAAYNSRLGLGGGGFHLADTPAGPAETVFLGVFRRDALIAVGGFDESLHRAQDWELNYRLRKAGYLVYFSPKLRVLYRPRSSVTALARQFYRTGQWRREVIRRHRDTASLRYLAPPVAVAGIGTALPVGLVGVLLRSRLLAAALLIPLLYVAFLGTATAMMGRVSGAARLRLPLVLAVMHLSWGAGFLRGVQLSGKA